MVIIIIARFRDPASVISYRGAGKFSCGFGLSLGFTGIDLAEITNIIHRKRKQKFNGGT
jgi:hypothetical protein